MSRSLAAVALAALIVVGLAACGPKATEVPAVPTEPVLANTMPTEVVITPTVEATAVLTTTAGLTATGSLTATGGITTTGALTTTEVLTNAVELEGTAWKMYAMGDPAKPTTVISTTTVSLAFAAGQISGNTGCGAYSASYVGMGDSIRISPPVLTGAPCTDPKMKAQEAAFVLALPATATWKGDELRLELISSDGKSVLLFLRDLAVAP